MDFVVWGGLESPYFSKYQEENKLTKKVKTKERGSNPLRPTAPPPHQIFSFQLYKHRVKKGRKEQTKENVIKVGANSRTTTLLNQSSQSLKLILPCNLPLPSDTVPSHGYTRPHKATH